MSSIHVPARDIPVPRSLSPAAQAVLSAVPPLEPVTYPAGDDLDGWRTLVAANDERIMAMLGGMSGQDIDAERREVNGVGVYVVTPPGFVDGDDRIVLSLHGGALIFLGGEACGRMAAIASSGTGLKTWGADYRMPPDHPYPTPLDDCVSVYKALLDECGNERVVVSGGSAGGNLAAALVVRARDEGLPLPAVVVLSTPEVDLTESGDSFSTNLGVDNQLRPLMPVNELYADGRPLDEPYLSPLFAELAGFPPTILTTGTRDLFLSNTVRMHRALRKAGVVAELHVIEAGGHAGFMGMAPEDHEVAAEVRAFIDRYCPPRH